MLNEKPTPDVDVLRLATPKQRFDEWMGATAYFHELRHYHDLIGSPSGIVAFLAMTRLVDELLVSLRNTAGSNLVPILHRAPSLPAARRYALHHAFLSVIFGDGLLPATKNNSAELDYSVWQFDPAGSNGFGLQIFDSTELGVRTSLPLTPAFSDDPLTGKTTERLVPFGLRALMEHTATEIQFCLTTSAGAEDPDKIDKVGEGRAFLQLHTDLMQAGFLVPYGMARWIAQVVAISGRSRSFDGEVPNPLRYLPGICELIPYVQAALDLGGYAPMPADGGTNWRLEHAGQRFMQLLQHRKKGKESFAGADQGVYALTGVSWRDFLLRYVAQMSSAPHRLIPPELLPEAAAFGLVADIRKSVLEEHLAIMRAKAEDLRPWLNPINYLESLNVLPRPPIQNSGFSSKERGALFLIWSIQLSFLEGIMETGTVTCPVMARMPLVGKLLQFPDPENPAQHTDCTRFIAGQLCGTYDGTYKHGQPRYCPFAVVIDGFFDQSRSAIKLDFGGVGACER
jgi:hypothetical protein